MPSIHTKKDFNWNANGDACYKRIVGILVKKKQKHKITKQMKYKLTVALLLVTGAVAFGGGNHDYIICSQKGCGGTCQYSDSDSDSFHNGGNCYSNANGNCQCQN